MRLCIIGNSHLGCVKKAWSLHPESKGFRPTFFGAPGNTMQGARLTGDTIFPPNEYTTHFRVMSGGLDRVRLEDYDAFLLVGLSLATEHACSAYKTHRLAQHARSGEFLISEACLEKAVDGSVTNSAAYYIARLIKSVRNAPILILPNPQPLTSILDKPVGTSWTDEDIRHYLYSLFCRSLLRTSTRDGFALSLQPEETLLGGFTRPEFAADPTQGDHRHMNAKYGLRILQGALPLIPVAGVGKRSNVTAPVMATC